MRPLALREVPARVRIILPLILVVIGDSGDVSARRRYYCRLAPNSHQFAVRGLAYPKSTKYKFRITHDQYIVSTTNTLREGKALTS